VITSVIGSLANTTAHVPASARSQSQDPQFNQCLVLERSAKSATGRFPQRERQQRVGCGPSLRGDERRLDERHRPFMPEWQLRAVEPPLGRFASTPAVDPFPTSAIL
jgi:hypothetical protein